MLRGCVKPFITSTGDVSPVFPYFFPFTVKKKWSDSRSLIERTGVHVSAENPLKMWVKTFKVYSQYAIRLMAKSLIISTLERKYPRARGFSL